MAAAVSFHCVSARRFAIAAGAGGGADREAAGRRALAVLPKPLRLPSHFSPCKSKLGDQEPLWHVDRRSREPSGEVAGGHQPNRILAPSRPRSRVLTVYISPGSACKRGHIARWGISRCERPPPHSSARPEVAAFATRAPIRRRQQRSQPRARGRRGAVGLLPPERCARAQTAGHRRPRARPLSGARRPLVPAAPPRPSACSDALAAAAAAEP